MLRWDICDICNIVIFVILYKLWNKRGEFQQLIQTAAPPHTWIGLIASFLTSSYTLGKILPSSSTLSKVPVPYHIIQKVLAILSTKCSCVLTSNFTFPKVLTCNFTLKSSQTLSLKMVGYLCPKGVCVGGV